MAELDEWFQQNRREFPWRKDPTPYQVWVSEVMLQQTRASVVVPYFERWMKLFPDVRSLAAAPWEKVIKAWEGLGYYRRARNLLQGAQQIVAEFGGEIPSKREDLESIQGVGSYTSAAILSFGFHERAAAVDGNVIRVITRLFAIEESVEKSSVKRKIILAAESLLDADKPWVTAEALIELGATVCTRNPRCEACPLQAQCLGKMRAEGLPIKREEKEMIHLKRIVIWLEVGGKVLVKKGELGRVMAELYEFPYFEMGEELWREDQILQKVEQVLGVKAEIVDRLKEISHTFTRYKARLYPFRLKGKDEKEMKGYEWVSCERLSELPFSSGHRKMIR